MKKRLLLLAVALLLAAGLFQGGGDGYAAGRVLRMATTTSTDNTGLLDYLAPRFRQDTGIELQWISVGTGKALALGRNCDVDVLLVHDPDAEKAFMEDGSGVDRTEVMYNDFVFIGPRKDPAHIRGMKVKEALLSIASKKAGFASRADNSGTHMAELGLWRLSGLSVPDRESWYIQTGQGMLATINIAAERDAYTLTDRGTFIKYESNWAGKPPLVVLVEGDPSLRNQYSVIAVNPKKCPSAKYDLARQYTLWITSPKIQQLIGEYKLMHKQLFIPNAGK